MIIKGYAGKMELGTALSNSTIAWKDITGYVSGGTWLWSPPKANTRRETTMTRKLRRLALRRWKALYG